MLLLQAYVSHEITVACQKEAPPGDYFTGTVMCTLYNEAGDRTSQALKLEGGTKWAAGGKQVEGGPGGLYSFNHAPPSLMHPCASLTLSHLHTGAPLSRSLIYLCVLLTLFHTPVQWSLPLP